MLLLAVNLSYKDGVGDASKPSWAELEFADAQKQKHDRGNQGNCQDGRNHHREVLREGKRLEQTAFLVLQGEDGHKGYGNHEEREETGSADLLHRVYDYLLRGTRTSFRLPMLQFLVRLF